MGADLRVPAPSGEFATFWNRVLTTEERLVAWFGRHSAKELSFFLAWTDRLGDRPYDIVDVTGLQYPYVRSDGSQNLSRPVGDVSTLNTGPLKSLFGSARSPTAEEKEAVVCAGAAEGRERTIPHRDTGWPGVGTGQSIRSLDH